MIEAPTDSLSDEVLIHLVRKNQPGAIEILVNRYKSMVFNLSYRLLGNYHVAEEATQDTFVKAFRSIYSFKGKSKFTTWLYRICYNTCITYKRRSNLEIIEINESNLQGIVASEHVGSIEQNDRSFYLNKALKNLDPEDATIVNLFYADEISTNEIATIVGISEGNVRIKLHRARKRLKSELYSILKDEAVNL
ncbi:MAG: RNA polymerase sigma factor [Bacteroidales bacterium]|nr:RNA polymerase sigma factor [Bacteroidales bacterium]MDD4385992.1 RNA polymerase sigma factor [Bacteroidales bacterium]